MHLWVCASNQLQEHNDKLLKRKIVREKKLTSFVTTMYISKERGEARGDHDSDLSSD
jgi:hypothetical protein